MKRTPQQVFAENLARLMEIRNLTQRELADIIGVSAPAVNDWLHRRKYPRIEKIQALADFFNVTRSGLTDERSTETTIVSEKDFMLFQQFIEFTKTQQSKPCNHVNEKSHIPSPTKMVCDKHDTRLFTIWKVIRKRCLNPITSDYEDFGGRGITICKEWQNDFQAFRNWAMANGYNDTLTIDRIDTNGNYTPENCRWISHKTRGRNARNKKMLKQATYNKETRRGRLS